MSARSKTQERRVARYFGVERTPLSGGASRHTRSDTLHPKLYIEVKSAIGPGGTNGWLFRWLRRLDWPNGLLRHGGGWSVPVRYFAHTDWLDSPIGACAYTGDMPTGADRLWKITQGLAAQEKKLPLLALLVKGKRGFWLVGDAESILAAQKARKEVVERECNE